MFKTLNLKQILFILMAIWLLLYVNYHALNPQNGLLQLLHLQDEFVQARLYHEKLMIKRQFWEQEIKAVHPESIDWEHVDRILRRDYKMIADGEKMMVLE